MKKISKILGIIILVLVIVAGVGLIYFVSSFPKVGPARDITIEPTPERIERGGYLVNHVTACFDCHSTLDWDYYAHPVVPGTEGKGGRRFGEDMGLPGTLYSSNITPAGLGDWTDGEIVRAITTGVNRDGKALFPFMPYQYYSKLSEEDIYSIVAYIKTLKPIDNDIPERKLNFPVNLIVRTIPQPYDPQPHPDSSDTIGYGKYLTTVGGCLLCHTPQVKGAPVEGMEFAGGFEFPLPNGSVVRSSNITPEVETGIGSWSKENFIAVFKSYASPESRKIPVGAGKYNTEMPWIIYAGMTEEDLGAIYDYLRTVKPIRNMVEKHSAGK